jgi:hypothetical protein
VIQLGSIFISNCNITLNIWIFQGKWISWIIPRPYFCIKSNPSFQKKTLLSDRSGTLQYIEQGTISPRENRPESEADWSPLFRAKVSKTSIHRQSSMYVKQRDKFTLMPITTNNISVLRRNLHDLETQNYLVWSHCDATMLLHKHGFIFRQWRFVWRYKSLSPAASDETGPVNQFVKQQTVHYISISRPNYRPQLFHCYVFTSTLYFQCTSSGIHSV